MPDDIVATAGVVVLAQECVLLVEHGDGAAHLTGAWGLPAGGIDAGESAAEAAARELREETGLQVDLAALVELPTLYRARIARKSGQAVEFSLRVFATRSYGGGLCDSEEGTPRWVRVAEVRSLPHLLPNTAAAVEAATSMLADE